jgi:hypothetical protein
VLHVCWQTRDGVTGQYLIAILYKSTLILASAARTDQNYAIRACIDRDSMKVEEVDNGRGKLVRSVHISIHSVVKILTTAGLQCHTAPFSWKLVFESDHQLYEMIMTACSPKEEREWRNRLVHPDSIKPFETLESAPYRSVTLNIKSLGTVFGKPGE